MTTAEKTEMQALMKSAPAGSPPAAYVEKLNEIKTLNRMAREIANLSWGKSLDHHASLAIAEYCRRFRIDPASEIEILGGRLYRNASYFIRRGTTLRKAGFIKDVQVDHVNKDPRLDALAKGDTPSAKAAREEIDRRTLQRIAHNIPDEALGACVITIIPVDGAPCIGANYAGGRKSDPVGTEHPGKTAETRAYRRAWRHLVDTIPSLAEQEGQLDEEGEAVETIVQQAKASAAAEIAGEYQYQENVADGTADYGTEEVADVMPLLDTEASAAMVDELFPDEAPAPRPGRDALREG